MENNTTKFERFCIGVVIALLCFLTVTIAARFLSRQILIEKLHWDNALTRVIWFDNSAAGAFGSNEEESAVVEVIDWASLYPFDDINAKIKVIDEPDVDTKINIEIFSRIKNIVFGLEDKINSYTSDLLIFNKSIVEAAYSYEQIIGWNFASFGEYNGIVELSDGYLSAYVEKRDVTAQYEALKQLDEYCQDNNMDFLYVAAPYKISEYDDSEISGSVDFSNQNANELMRRLSEAGIDNYDIRQTIHDEGLDNHSLFYRTDHHWLTTTGMWGAQQILKYCNNTYGWSSDTTKLDLEQFDLETYPDFFLGSQGKKVTLSRTTPDDFTLLYPKYDTLFHYVVYDNGIDDVGDYSICYNMNGLGNRDYYNDNPYGICNYGDDPLLEIENLLDAEDKKIVIIHDSFGDCLVSGLALGVKNVCSLDIRHFTGSVEKYINETKPDLVIVMYNAGSAGADVDYSTHTDEFDFR